ncbi:MAG: TAXI family TRAP transporter solute-binding subunit [Beijerinckiaceae bacterium]
MFTAAAISAAMSAAFAAATPTMAQTLTIGTSPQGSSNYALGNAIGKVMGDVAKMKVRVVPYGGGQKILPSIDAKRFDFMLASSTDAFFAYNGKGEFEGKPTKNLRAIGVPLTYYLSWFVRNDAPYKSIKDLKGKKVAVGYNANVSQRRSVLSQMAAAGLKESDFDGVKVPHVVRGAEDLAQGKIEATSFAVGAGKVAEINAKVAGGIRYLNFPTDADSIKRMREFMPMGGVKLIQPAPNLVGIVGPTNVQTEDYVVVSGAHVSNEVAYQVAKILVENQADLKKVNRQFGRYDVKEVPTDLGVPFHDGAIKYFKEKGMWPPKKK